MESGTAFIVRQEHPMRLRAACECARTEQYRFWVFSESGFGVPSAVFRMREPEFLSMSRKAVSLRAARVVEWTVASSCGGIGS